MSQKMPVTDLLTESFTFGLQRFWTIARCLLVPYLIIIVGIIIVTLALIDFPAIDALDNTGDWPGEVGTIIDAVLRISWQGTLAIFVIATLILSIPFMGGIVSIFRLVGLGEEPGGWFRLRMDAPVWRTIVAYIIWTVLQWIIYGIAFAITYAMIPDALSVFANLRLIEDQPELLAPLVGFIVLAWFISLLMMIVVFTKLAPFPAATACENRLMLISSWHMTKGHFWTILGGYILMSLALGFANLVYQVIAQLVSVMAELLGGGILAGLIVLIVTLIIFATSIAVTFFMTGVQMAFPAAIYRRLWVEADTASVAGEDEAGR